jgi:hypothetical protein
MRLKKVKELQLDFVESPLPPQEVSLLWTQLYKEWEREPYTWQVTTDVWAKAGVLAQERFDAQERRNSSTHAGSSKRPSRKRKDLESIHKQVYHDTMRSRFQVAIGRKFGDTVWVALLLRDGFINADMVKCCNEIHCMKRNWNTEERVINKECW